MRARGLLLVLVCLAGCGGEADRPAASAPAASGVSPVASAPEQRPPVKAAADRDPAPEVPVISETVAYGEAEDRNLIGVLALPADSFEPPPGILVVHDGWGLNDDIRALARRLAGEGFVVLAVDLFGNEIAQEPLQAGELMARVTAAPDLALENIRQGVDYLRRYALAPRVAALGWSFGGTWALEAALAPGDNIDAVVTYYGQIGRDDSRFDALHGALIGIFAGNDSSISADSVERFRAALNRAGKDADVRIYEGTTHGFANPHSSAYDADSAQDAWSDVVGFLRSRLK